ncbi:MAG: hypothetical protein HC877_24235 [Thioploca sp.]|nr:hypothetical protein [Thioploca sp.]
MKKIKDDAKFLLETGLLFEINRTILHKFGYALVIDTDYNNKRKVVIVGLFEPNEPDDEGWIYDEESFQDGAQKYQKFLEQIGKNKIDKRKEKLGFIIQEK